MKLFLHIVLILFFISGLLIAGDEDKQSPRMVFDYEEFDFGAVQGDTVLTHVFILTNTGHDTLNIKKVKPS